MGNKAFLKLVIGTLVVGVGLGVAVIGVVALGDGNGEETAQNNLPQAAASGAGTQARTDQGSEEKPTEERTNEVQSDETDEEASAQVQQPFQGQFGQGFGGRGGSTGTIEEVEGTTLTLNTLQGPLQATVGQDTFVQRFAEGTLADLEAGMTATVVGQRAQDGTVIATSISILPEGGAGFLGRGGFAGPEGIDGQEQLNQLRERIQSDEITQEELAEIRQQFQGQFGERAPGGRGQLGQGGLGGQGFGGGGGLTGTIESIEGAKITVNTSQGPLQATVGEETTIQILAQGTLADLQPGVLVTVVGQREEDGSIQAASLFIAPEDGEGFFGGRLPGGGGLPSGSGGDAQ